MSSGTATRPRRTKKAPTKGAAKGNGSGKAKKSARQETASAPSPTPAAPAVAAEAPKAVKSAEKPSAKAVGKAATDKPTENVAPTKGKREPAPNADGTPRPKPKMRAAPPPVDLDVDPDVLEFIKAIDDYRAAHDRPFPTWSEVLYVLKNLGYKRR